MAGNGKKPNNELFDLNDILAGVVASDESLDDILADIYGTKSDAPSAGAAASDESLDDILADIYGTKPDTAADGPVKADAPDDEVLPVRHRLRPEEPENFDLSEETGDIDLPEETGDIDLPEETGDIDLPEDFGDIDLPEEFGDFDLPEEFGDFDLPEEFGDFDLPEETEVQESFDAPKEAKEPDVPEPSEEPEEPAETPSAWVEPASADLPPELLASVFDEMDRAARPDGPPEQRPSPEQLRRNAQRPREEEYRATPPRKQPAEDGQRRFPHLRNRANAFADSMFSQTGDGDETAELAEQYIPGTDQETEPPDEPQRRRRARSPRREPPAAEDIPPRRLSHIYFIGLNFMSRRVPILLLFSLICCWMTLGGQGILPLPAALRDAPRLLAGVELLMVGWCLVFSLDVVWMGLATLRERRFSLHTLADLAVFCTVLDTLVFCAVGREGPMPYCAPACLLLFCSLWGAYDRKAANYRACRQAALSQTPWRVTKDEMLWNSRDTFTRERGDGSGFGAQIQAPGGAETAQCRVAPVIAAAALVFALLASVFHGRSDLFLWCLSAILTASSPLSVLLCYGQPWMRLTRRLERTGSAAAGWPGVCRGGGDAGVLIFDSDLFPAGSIQFNGIKVYGNIALEKLASCTASLIRISGSGLADLFDDLVRTQGGFYRNVHGFQCYDAGGLGGYIRGEQILVGSASFMKVMDVPLPEDLRVNQAVFCAIDGALRGVFALSYARTDAVRPSLASLLRAHLVPVLVPRDFNTTPNMLHQRLKLPVDRMEYPPVDRRLELTEPGQTHADTLTALLSRDGMEPYAETVVGCRRMYRAVRRCTVLCLAASVVGLILSFYLTSVRAFASLSPVNMLIFLVLWLIPSLLLAGNINRY